ncbi:MAG: Regulator of chromosome condensation (RCC1) repeat-containing protein [Verrucomicrobia bacterium]|nr:MAG: Regulator of chromosome condensation (RCC1) repeat-containing protein [Verrucomicrobiota bacterium]
MRRLLAWGKNDQAQCSVPAGLAGVAAIAAGGSHALGLKYDGTIVTRGNNKAKQCDVPAELQKQRCRNLRKRADTPGEFPLNFDRPSMKHTHIITLLTAMAGLAVAAPEPKAETRQ